MTVRIGKGTTIGAALRVWALVLLWGTSAAAQPAWVAPPEPAVRPELPSRAELDADNNRIDDRLDHDIGALRRALAREKVPQRRKELAARLAAPVRIELVFTEQVTQQQIEAFAAMGGRIEHLYQSVSYGWSGTLPGASVDALAAAMGPSLLVVVPDIPARLHMDEATRTGRVRPIWANGFAGNANGLSGTSDITIGIVDTGVDDSHTDLTGRVEYWKDYTSDNEATPRDIVQHGSHVAGIALGTGAAFGVGPGTLKYTDSGDASGLSANQFFLSTVHLPAAAVTFTEAATFLGGGLARLRLVARTNGVGGGFISIADSGSTLLASPISLVANTNGNTTQVYSTALPQISSKPITRYAIANSVATYPAVGDGFNAMRGVAPGARWAGAKVFTNTGSGSSTTIGAAMDDLVTQRSAHNIKVVNMSLGLIGAPGIDTTLRAKANTMVSNGIVVVCSAGNDGPGTTLGNVVDDPGRAALVLTVGASNDVNTLTQYTSSGFSSPGPDEDFKPDLLAPGGSDYYSNILSVDSNDADAEISTFSDKVANDYYSIKGTSMASPFAAGSAALVIDAMQKAGTTWGFASSGQPLFVKMLLCASSTETNAGREAGTGTDPTLGRAAAPKDLFEGYGVMNPDAAVEAVSQTYSGGTLNGSTNSGRYDRRAWGRLLGITSGPAITLTLTVPPDADYDLYLYSGVPDAKGNPVVRASSTNAGVGVAESITFTPTASEPRYLFIKRVPTPLTACQPSVSTCDIGNPATCAGTNSTCAPGQAALVCACLPNETCDGVSQTCSRASLWTLIGSTAVGICGDGTRQGNEDCDDGNTVSGDCCSATCTFESSGSPCASDSNPCTLDQCNGAGSCTHPAGNAGAVCRAAGGVCDVPETCTGSSTSCPANAFAASTTSCRAAGGVCDTAENCTGTSAACPSDTFADSTTVCRASAGVCDPQETCTGTSGTCPANALAGTATVCRGSAGICDVQESCSGTSATCPADTLAAPTTVCRASRSVCDAQETCTGAGAACPADAFSASTAVCRASTGVCDTAETCTGTSGSCPGDAFAASTTVCRAPGGVCDVAETCTGSSASCPVNTFDGSATVCRAANGVCDVAERCTGASASCPADGFAPTSTTCRASTGVCDPAENCSGLGGACPADALAATTTVCRASAGVCDLAETCTGATATCPADAVAGTTTTCRASAGECDIAETCDGAGKGCPADAVVSADTPCASDGLPCTTDVCDGVSATCVHAPGHGGTVCRPSSGVCDVEETCSGASAACPADAVAGTATTCRASSGECDLPERCNGSAKSCPADVLVSASTGCSSDSNPCTDDVCSGSSGACQHPANSAACNDNVFCNGADTCSNGTCSQHAGDPCPGADGDGNCAESCNEAAGNCSAADPNGSPCDDGQACTISDSCTGGVCSGQASLDCAGTTTTTLPAVLCGDTNDDTRITAGDALFTLRSAVGTATCTLQVCDYTGDGKISASDALAILRKAVGQNVAAKCPGTVASFELVSTTVTVTTTTTLDGQAVPVTTTTLDDRR